MNASDNCRTIEFKDHSLVTSKITSPSLTIPEASAGPGFLFAYFLLLFCSRPPRVKYSTLRNVFWKYVRIPNLNCKDFVLLVAYRFTSRIFPKYLSAAVALLLLNSSINVQLIAAARPTSKEQGDRQQAIVNNRQVTPPTTGTSQKKFSALVEKIKVADTEYKMYPATKVADPEYKMHAATKLPTLNTKCTRRPDGCSRTVGL